MAAADQVEVLVRRFDPELPLPRYAQPADAGADLLSARDVTLAPGERAVVPTGVGIALPPGYAAFVHPRSGLAARHGLSVVNAPGTIDAGYRGEIKVVLLNTDRRETIRLRRGDRIAQLIVQQVAHAVFRPVEQLPDSVRGTGGFGSTGTDGLAETSGLAETGGLAGTNNTSNTSNRTGADGLASPASGQDRTGDAAATGTTPVAVDVPQAVGRSGDDVAARR